MNEQDLKELAAQIEQKRSELNRLGECLGQSSRIVLIKSQQLDKLIQQYILTQRRCAK
jgi:hypothetical protein